MASFSTFLSNHCGLYSDSQKPTANKYFCSENIFFILKTEALPGGGGGPVLHDRGFNQANDC